jgi:putative nucleotidyltransferase with HDIG domain
VIRKLYLIPILLSAMWFGARGAASSTVFATLVCGGLAGIAWPAEVSSQVERVGEVAVFWLVGGLSASFFEQQKRFVGQIEVANDNTLMALAAALDVREHNTGIHSQRVADYTLRLAQEVGVRDKGTLDDFWRGALLHDVGKIGIPDNVLLKPGRLSEEEWAVMRNHPEVGARMLREIEFLRGPTEIVLSHHERYDGEGYPRKLKGDRIPLGARLFAVIDVYDALTTDRAYHTARSHTEALIKIRGEMVAHFDPSVVAAFAKIPFEELREIAKKNQTPLRFASPPVASLHQAASVPSPGS